MQLSKNEWDPLKSVIVGIANDAKIPKLDSSLRLVNYADIKDINNIPYGNYPKQVIDEANEDLNKFCDFLQSLDVMVYRPDINHIPKYYNYCPRDTVLIYDNLILATPNPLRARADEWYSMEHILSNYSSIVAPIIYRNDELYNNNCLRNPDILALNEIEPAFDAANILRDNDNLYYLVSNSGNKLGAQLLQEYVGPNKKVWLVEGIYSYMHLDSTIALLREGLMLLNPSRIKDIKQLPKPLQSWDYIWCPEPIDIGHYPGYCNASKWINMNLFSVNPNLVVLEENQTNLSKELNKYGIETQMMPMRHQRTLGGGFHCVTLDLVRS